jgi:hypothetical protein
MIGSNHQREISEPGQVVIDAILEVDPRRSMFLSGARSCACDEVRVGAGEVDGFVGVDPSHPIADAASALDDFEDLTLARKLSGLACVNDDRISGVCVHHNLQST